MPAVCCYFQVHQPYRLRPGFNFFSIGTAESFEDEALNRRIMRKVAERCYLPANAAMLELIERHQGAFRVSFSVSGVALEQFEKYEPRLLESFRRLAATGCVEFLAETYYHSLAYLFSHQEFKRQVRMHQKKVQELFGVTPKAFRNTELIYDDQLPSLVADMGFRTVLAEGADHVLGWRSPNFVYRPASDDRVTLLLKNYRLSDDVAFRFSDQSWSEWPLDAGKYARWIHQVAGAGDVINLFMDYETFGEHQWESTGIFDFLRHFPAAVLKHPDFRFLTPSEVAREYRPVAALAVPRLTSWADSERDVSAWQGNPMQNTAAAAIFGMERDVLATGDRELAHLWRKMTTSDHFYYMCTKYFHDGDVHKYFSPYASPYDACILFANALNQLKHLTASARQAKARDKAARRAELPGELRRDRRIGLGIAQRQLEPATAGPAPDRR